MEFRSVTPVILGMLGTRPRTGYEIKSFVDRSTRFFWAASYGQIYPELTRLAEAGLVEAERADSGDRKRVEYRITDAGRAAVEEWLARPAETFELRDESLLKLFFAGLAPETAPRILAEKQARHERTAAELRALESEVAGLADAQQLTVLRGGIHYHDMLAAWCGQSIADLDEPKEEI